MSAKNSASRRQALGREAAVAAVIEAGARAAARGWTPATAGNFSAAIDENTIAITRTGVDKGALTPDDVATLDLAELLLMDSAKIQEEDAAYANRKKFSKHKPALPLYTSEDVERALITNTLRDVGGNRERASQLLGISTRTLYRKIKTYGLSGRGG